MPEFILRTAFEIGAKNFPRVAKLGGRWCIGLLKWSELVVGLIRTSVPRRWCWRSLYLFFIWKLAIDRYLRVGVVLNWSAWRGNIYIENSGHKLYSEKIWIGIAEIPNRVISGYSELKIFDIFRWILEKIYWTFTVWKMDFGNIYKNSNIMKTIRFVSIVAVLFISKWF